MTRYALFYRFDDDGKLVTTWFSVMTTPASLRSEGWRPFASEDDVLDQQIADLRDADEHRWDSILKERN